MFNFEKLIVYQEAVDLSLEIYRLTKNWPKEEIFGLTSQARRAAVSVALNIAEGSSRTKKDFRHFLDLSRGSVYEVATILLIAKRLGYILEDEYLKTYESCNNLSKKVSALKNSLQ